MKKSIHYIAFTAMEIALYVTLSMTAKIPIISHISLDLGYIALAFACYHFGAISGMVVGGAGCAIISMLTSGWFPPGWFVTNLLIGFMCGLLYIRSNDRFTYFYNLSLTIIFISIGIIGIKTVMECNLYAIPLEVKFPKNLIAGFMDTIVMGVGLLVARHPAFNKLGEKETW